MVLKFCPKFISFKLLHPQNILFIFVTFVVSKLLRSNSFKLLHPENILHILLTFVVLKFCPKFISFKLLHSENIKLISLTFVVSKLLRSNFVKSLHS